MTEFEQILIIFVVSYNNYRNFAVLFEIKSQNKIFNIVCLESSPPQITDHSAKK